MKRLLGVFLCLVIAVSGAAQTDSIGVYAVRSSEIKPIERLNYNQTKISGNPFGGKARLIFKGAASSNRFTGSATFRLYFGTPTPEQVAAYFMFAPPYSIKDFGVGKFDIKKGNRRLTGSKISIFGGSTIGAAEADDITMTTKQISKDVYEITISGPAGEYCIMPIINGAGGYAGVFDFALE